MSIYKLYIKEHRVTGLKYLGITIRDDHESYLGSGTRWLRHLRKYGTDIKTTVIGVYNSKEELREAGIYYSNLWNVVASNKWANLKIEEGDGGFYHINSLPKHQRPNLIKIQKMIEYGTSKFGGTQYWTEETFAKCRSQCRINSRAGGMATKGISKNQGSRNSNFGNHWYVLRSANSLLDRKRFHPTMVPDGYITTLEWRESKRKRPRRYWANNGTEETLFLTPEFPNGWKLGRLRH